MATTTPAPTEAGTASAADERIAQDRERIDELDRRIIDLVQERMEVSARIQRARIGAGGRRVNLSREMGILTRYRERLGRPGTSLAMTLLELCRGRV
ncbi:chorismate mutase [Streptomyces verrucosisporus]|uniref:chorismate mutase n=1 Tax=Streptomyces verrucosisporus TaxID=1695161 RepID=UPI0019D029FC|nr:chorismate mutase [Streptomyces verrucosisporus]MBN3931166.1 chorismate mutase [Streptomyces verrucosisporus]